MSMPFVEPIAYNAAEEYKLWLIRHANKFFRRVGHLPDCEWIKSCRYCDCGLQHIKHLASEGVVRGNFENIPSGLEQR